MSGGSSVPVRTYHVVNVVHPKLSAKLGEFRNRLSARAAGYPVVRDWHPWILQGWGEFPQVPMTRAAIYRGAAGKWAYSHHQAIARFGGRYVAAWSNGFLHEDYPGQEVHYAWSCDGVDWSPAQVVAPTPFRSGLVRNCAGLYAGKDRLYCYVGVAADFGRQDAPPGMFAFSEPRIHLDVYETADLEHWTQHERVCDHVYLFEGPRLTRGGKLLCCGSDIRNHRALVLIWDDPSRAADKPRTALLPESPEGILPEQGTWYQTDDGRIWMYLRDGSISCRLALTWSDDEGKSWSETLRTDFPNTYSRAFAGRLMDGRYFITGNNYDIFLNRLHLLIALSDDGLSFDRQYTLIEGQTTRRINGRHKEDGYHYPNCCIDGDRLLVIYSVNKEDIEVASVDMTKVK